MGAVAAPIDGEAGAVRAAVAHGCEHARQHGAELRLERLVLQKKSNDSAHFSTAADQEPLASQGNGGQAGLSTVRNNNFL